MKQRQEAVKTHKIASQSGLGVEEGFLEEVVCRLGLENFIGTASWGVDKKRNIKKGKGFLSRRNHM